MNTVDLLGYSAAFITSLSFLPQVIKTWREKSARDISILMFLIVAFNEIMWVIYRALLSPINWIIICTNNLVPGMLLTLNCFKIQYR